MPKLRQPLPVMLRIMSNLTTDLLISCLTTFCMTDSFFIRSSFLLEIHTVLKSYSFKLPQLTLDSSSRTIHFSSIRRKDSLIFSVTDCLVSLISSCDMLCSLGMIPARHFEHDVLLHLLCIGTRPPQTGQLRFHVSPFHFLYQLCRHVFCIFSLLCRDLAIVNCKPDGCLRAHSALPILPAFPIPCTFQSIFW